MIGITPIMALLLQSGEPAAVLPQDEYATCLFDAALKRMPSKKIADLKGEQVTELIATLGTTECAERRRMLERSLSASGADSAGLARVTDNIVAGVLIDGPVEIVPVAVCPKRIKRDGVCF